MYKTVFFQLISGYSVLNNGYQIVISAYDILQRLLDTLNKQAQTAIEDDPENSPSVFKALISEIVIVARICVIATKSIMVLFCYYFKTVDGSKRVCRDDSHELYFPIDAENCQYLL